MIDFEPPVPPPAMSSSESPCRSRIFSKGMPSLAVRIWASGEAWPWP
jgi:hypothetical protein